jgi:histidyl-tRNA synthetase
MKFYYELENAEHIENVEEIERALEMSAFVCQQEFERAIDLYHEIHFDSADSDGAIVSDIQIDGEDVWVTLDCEKAGI